MLTKIAFFYNKIYKDSLITMAAVEYQHKNSIIESWLASIAYNRRFNEKLPKFQEYFINKYKNGILTIDIIKIDNAYYISKYEWEHIICKLSPFNELGLCENYYNHNIEKYCQTYTYKQDVSINNTITKYIIVSSKMRLFIELCHQNFDIWITQCHQSQPQSHNELKTRFNLFTRYFKLNISYHNNEFKQFQNTIDRQQEQLLQLKNESIMQQNTIDQLNMKYEQQLEQLNDTIKQQEIQIRKQDGQQKIQEIQIKQ